VRDRLAKYETSAERSDRRSRVSKVPREIAEIMLNHVTGGGKTDLDESTIVYEYLEEKRDALAKIERHLMRLIAD